MFDEPWLVVDTLLKEGASPALPDVNVQHCDPRRPHTFFVGPQNLRRWEFKIMPGEDPAEMAQPEAVWRLRQLWLTPDQATLWRAATYRFHALVARQWRKGNVFRAGDACHMAPPFLAQGMVQGIKDTANLAWKIAAVCNGTPPQLLDTYQTERRPHVFEVIRTTKELGQIICELDPALAAARTARMRAEMAAGRGVTVRQNLFPPLRGGALLEAGSPASCVGTPSPQPWVRSGDRVARLDDIAGARFRVLALPSFDLDPHVNDRCDSLGVPIYRLLRADGAAQDALVEQDRVLSDWMKTHTIRAILVRPDHIVFAGLNSSGDFERALDVYEHWIGDKRDRIRSGNPAQKVVMTNQHCETLLCALR